MFKSRFQSCYGLLWMLVNLPTRLLQAYRMEALRYHDTQHLLRLDDYLLKDMGLHRVGNRIEAVDPSRIEHGAPHLPGQQQPRNPDSTTRRRTV